MALPKLNWSGWLILILLVYAVIVTILLCQMVMYKNKSEDPSEMTLCNNHSIQSKKNFAERKSKFIR